MELAKMVGSDAERDQLFLDIQSCAVEEVVPDGSLLKFHIIGYERPPYRGQETFRGKDQFPVEGRLVDEDGGAIDVLIFSDQRGRLLELELVKHAGGELLGPEWGTFRIK